MIEILLVDDHPSVGEGTKNLIEKEADMKVTVIYSSEEALKLVSARQFDIMLFDLNMPNMNGLELTRKVKVINSDAIIVIYTGFDIAPNFNILVEAGVSGFISKASSRDQLIMAIRCALRGDAIIPSFLLRQLRRTEIFSTTNNKDQVEGVTISEKEHNILREAANGLNNRQIADMLFMSQRTVEYNLSRIFEKLRVRSRAEAIKEGKRLGLLDDEEIRS
ncbi:response regulator transcription factor [Paenibacillus albiflavus]|uniref:Response regulator transcription factor n=1 Tax=Paenibacillus albiflavus TaxID=2545760 RepID=A0A4R4EAQ7_9BACL|nr:response regulator transcription factor [Paenibacillus albiflavus]TCZ76367.1 response regulator transcription factor [Paenibacillus albiflavus]